MSTIGYCASKVDLFHPARSKDFLDVLPESEATLCAEMARLAYCRLEPCFQFDQQQILRVLACLGFTCTFFENLKTPEGTGTHAFLALHADADLEKKLAVLVFRGTDAGDPTDLADDAASLQLEWRSGGLVHRGFAAALEPLLSNIIAALEPLEARILFTGHSLGAAMATLLASVKSPDFLYTFGSPRVGDDRFVSTLTGVSNHRFVNCCDVVPRLPPECIGDIKYAHYDQAYYIDRRGQVVVNPAGDVMEQDRMVAASEYLVDYAWKTGDLPVRELADHAPINYVEAVAADSGEPKMARWELGNVAKQSS